MFVTILVHVSHLQERRLLTGLQQGNNCPQPNGRAVAAAVIIFSSCGLIMKMIPVPQFGQVVGIPLGWDPMA